MSNNEMRLRTIETELFDDGISVDFCFGSEDTGFTVPVYFCYNLTEDQVLNVLETTLKYYRTKNARKRDSEIQSKAADICHLVTGKSTTDPERFGQIYEMVKEWLYPEEKPICDRGPEKKLKIAVVGPKAVLRGVLPVTKHSSK